ncbi:MAG: hypothetical protein WKG00_08720 [Polyangiaceae bacterium]
MRLSSILRAGLVPGLAAALAVLVACGSDEASGASGNAGDGGAGGEDSGGGGDVSSAAQGGTGGSTSATGAGGAVTELTIDSLESDVTIIDAFPSTVTFLAHVSDPDGPSDVEGGHLVQAGSLGSFVAVDAVGNWELAVTFGEGDLADGFNAFYAQFEDMAGNVAERSMVLQVDSKGCVTRPDRQACRDCYCEADPPGCQHYTEREYQFLYCGSTCSDACSAFCATYDAGTPDPALIDDVCQGCNPSFDDVGAFEDSCIADIPECFSFLADVGNCG